MTHFCDRFEGTSQISTRSAHRKIFICMYELRYCANILRADNVGIYKGLFSRVLFDVKME